MFSINHVTLIYQLLPVLMRKLLTMQFIFAAMKGLRDVYDQLIITREDVNYKLQFTAQVIYMEHVLNDKFDSVTRLIKILDGADIEFLYIHNNSEPEPPIYLYNNSEIFNGVYMENNSEQISDQAFIINIPNTSIDQNQLRKVVDTYKAAGKTYIINII